MRLIFLRVSELSLEMQLRSVVEVVVALIQSSTTTRLPMREIKVWAKEVPAAEMAHHREIPGAVDLINKTKDLYKFN